jgi:DNA processing protein
MFREFLAFSMMPQVGSIKIKKLLQSVAKPADVFGLSFQQLCKIPGIGPQAAAEIRAFNNWPEVDHILERTQQGGYHMLTLLDEEYPLHLAQLYDAPPLVWVHGNLEALKKPSIAVVGTRNMGKYAAQQIKAFIPALVDSGFAIVSGLAKGVDTLAHYECLNHNGITVAVIGSGFNRLYPAANKPLARKILDQGGCLLSEYPPDKAAEAKHFPTRNRIVSGLSAAVWVVESGKKGGSMITADRALDQNRDVFALPHVVDHPQGEGCNWLIRASRARLVMRPEDIIQEVGPQYGLKLNTSKTASCGSVQQAKWKVKHQQQAFEPIALSILTACDATPKDVDSLLEELGLDWGLLQQHCFNLELQGCLEQQPGARFKSL